MTAPDDAVVEALRAAEDALRDHACYDGDKALCRRSEFECRTECGKSAGDALLLVVAAIATLERET